ncbi:unannotated protein [freshwater metagenome]|uniref:Unannotated protein n=1 Tax=freshwater metagenome TaxID=449393 RepID=A0A6J6EEQ9_9ZZZZ
MSTLDGFALTTGLLPVGADAKVYGTPMATAPEPVPLALTAETRNVVRVPFTSPVVPAATTQAVIEVHVNPLVAPVTNGVVAVVVPSTVYVPPDAQLALHTSTL